MSSSRPVMEEQEREGKTSLTFPLTSKRLQLHMQLIARDLDLPTAASACDLSVMISGRLHENSHDPSKVQVVITMLEEGEELSLQDIDGIFLKIPPEQCASPGTMPAPISEVSVDLQDTFVLQETHDFSVEIRYLEHVLSSLQQELDDTQTQLLEAQEEVKCLRMGNSEYSAKLLEVQGELELERERVAELARENEALRQQLSSSELQSLKEEVKRGQDKVVELWHTNCKQLLNHDDEMFKKDEEIKILSDKLQKLEIELATMKLERLSAGTSTSVSHSISSSFVGSVPGGVSVSVSGPEGSDNKPITATIPRWSGGFGTATRAEVVTTTLSTVPSRVCLASTTNTNTQSTLPSYLSIAPSVSTSGMSYLTHSAINPRISHTTQPEKQVTNVSTTLSGAFFTSRPVHSAGAATTGTSTATTTQWSSQ